MNTVHSANPVTPPQGKKPVQASDTSDNGAVLPWALALQSALEQQVELQVTAPDDSLAAPLSENAIETPAAPEATTPSPTDSLCCVDPLIAALTPPSTLPAAIASATLERPNANTSRQAGVAGTAAAVDATQLTALAASEATPGKQVSPSSIDYAPVSRMISHATHGIPTTPVSAAANESAFEAIQPHSAHLAAGSSYATQAPVSMPAANAPVLDSGAMRIDTPMGSAHWGAELSSKVTLLINDKQQVAELHVNPPELGPLDITLTFGENETSAIFTSPHGAVREAVESALPRLREVLAENGIQLGNASVTSESPRDGAAFNSARDQQQRQPDNTSAEAKNAGQPAAQPAIAPRRLSLVDLFA